MIQVFDTGAARRALDRRLLRCPDCREPLKPWGRTRERTVRGRGGAKATFRPDRGRCTGCGATHVILGANFLPGRAYAAGLIGSALLSSARGRGHRAAAREAGIPEGTVRGWIRRARRSSRAWIPVRACRSSLVAGMVATSVMTLGLSSAQVSVTWAR